MQSRKKKLFEFQMLRVLALLRTMRDKVIVFSPPELTYDVSKFTWFLTPPPTVAVFKFDQFLTLPSLKNADVLNGQSHVSFDTDWKLARIIF